MVDYIDAPMSYIMGIPRSIWDKIKAKKLMNLAPDVYLLYRGARQESYSHTSDRRFSSTTSRSSTELTVSELTLADTALYYCALLVEAQ